MEVFVRWLVAVGIVLLLVPTIGPNAAEAAPAECIAKDVLCRTGAEQHAIKSSTTPAGDSDDSSRQRCVRQAAMYTPSDAGCDGCLWYDHAVRGPTHSSGKAAEKPTRPAPPGSVWRYVICYPPGEGDWSAVAIGAPQPTISAVALAEAARDSFRLPLPRPATSPAAGTLVNLPTFLYLDNPTWTSRTAAARVATTAVTVTATPQTMTWDMDENRSDREPSTITCAGPGAPYDRSGPPDQVPACGYRYRATSAQQLGTSKPGYLVTVTTSWQITWTCQGVCDEPGGTLAPLTPTTTTRLPVYQARAQLVRPD